MEKVKKLGEHIRMHSSNTFEYQENYYSMAAVQNAELPTILIVEE